MKQRSQSVAHGAVRAPQTRQRPIVGSSISARSSRTTRAAAASSSAAARSIVTPATPGYCSANQRRIDASRAACSASSRPGRVEPLRIEDPADDRAAAACRRRPPRASVPRSGSAVLVDRRLHELPDVGELERAPRVVQRVAHRVEPREQRLDRLDLEPAVDAPVAQRRVPPRVQRRLELVDARHVEVGELRAQAARVDDAVAEVAVLDRDVRDERGAHELRIGIRPRHAGEHADVAALVEAEAAGAAGDLRDLPRLEVAPLLARRTSSSRRRAASRTAG